MLVKSPCMRATGKGVPSVDGHPPPSHRPACLPLIPAHPATAILPASCYISSSHLLLVPFTPSKKMNSPSVFWFVAHLRQQSPPLFNKSCLPFGLSQLIPSSYPLASVSQVPPLTLWGLSQPSSSPDPFGAWLNKVLPLSFWFESVESLLSPFGAWVNRVCPVPVWGLSQSSPSCCPLGLESTKSALLPFGAWVNRVRPVAIWGWLVPGQTVWWCYFYWGLSWLERGLGRQDKTALFSPLCDAGNLPWHRSSAQHSQAMCLSLHKSLLIL